VYDEVIYVFEILLIFLTPAGMEKNKKKVMRKVSGELRYDPNDIIGKGFCTVFSGFYKPKPVGALGGFLKKDHSLSTPVAVKQIQIANLKNLQEVQNEVDLMIKVKDHPNILRYISKETTIDFL